MESCFHWKVCNCCCSVFWGVDLLHQTALLRTRRISKNWNRRWESFCLQENWSKTGTRMQLLPSDKWKNNKTDEKVHQSNNFFKCKYILILVSDIIPVHDQPNKYQESLLNLYNESIVASYKITLGLTHTMGLICCSNLF